MINGQNFKQSLKLNLVAKKDVEGEESPKG